MTEPIVPSVNPKCYMLHTVIISFVASDGGRKMENCVIAWLQYIYKYIVCPKSNESDFFVQRRRARKGNWGLRQVKGEPRYTV